MDNKTLSIISYITIIGWLLAYYIDKEKMNEFRKYHLKQSFALAMITLAGYFLMTLFVPFPNILLVLGRIINIGVLVLAVIGIMNAVKELEKPLPLIGKFAEDKVNFL